jgi:chemotaxis signal transduction protein
MAIYLQIRTGQLHLMLDALQVHEIMGLEGVIDGAQGHAQWRDQVLTSVDVGDFFQLPHAPAQMAVIYSPSEQAEPVLFKVEEILGLRELQDRQWGRLPALPPQSMAFFDAVWLEPERERQSFRLRHPLDLDTFKGVAPAGLDEEVGHDGMDGVGQ